MSNSEYKELLEVELVRLISELETIATLEKTTGDWTAVPDATEQSEADSNSEADGVEEWQERQATVTQLETLYQNTKRALAKIEAGIFGLCEICQNHIEEDRLRAIPTARTCKAHLNDERTLTL
ncbi:MAG: TraR/DksA C4-type zinc finger protein [Candidatus Pacebacteria bacterium]|nr:TraR/DksA C4-type zinc finger protein [Candidatus Paceibacterota bacterium]